MSALPSPSCQGKLLQDLAPPAQDPYGGPCSLRSPELHKTHVWVISQLIAKENLCSRCASRGPDGMGRMVRSHLEIWTFGKPAWSLWMRREEGVGRG